MYYVIEFLVVAVVAFIAGFFFGNKYGQRAVTAVKDAAGKL
jgi:hypothetical protein